MYLLALDTSNQTMSVAVMHDQTLLAETTINHKKNAQRTTAANDSKLAETIRSHHRSNRSHRGG